MSVTLSIIISLLALLATFYQLYLQRVHNEKSLRPLGQIYFWDRDNTIAVRIVNNGLGPLLIDRLMFSKSDTLYSSIKDCLDLDPKSYMHVSTNDGVERVILPNAYLTVFETTFEDADNTAYRDLVRVKLSFVTLQVQCHDIYDNEIILKRGCKWFSRHRLESTTH